MLIEKSKDNSFELFSVPTAMIWMVGLFIILQLIILAFIFKTTNNPAELLGYSLFEKIFNSAIYITPLLFALFAFFAMPVAKIEIDRLTKIVSIKRFTPFRKTKKFGFSYIKNGIISTENDSQSLFFELKSGEKISLVEDKSESVLKITEITEIAEKANKYLQNI